MYYPTIAKVQHSSIILQRQTAIQNLQLTVIVFYTKLIFFGKRLPIRLYSRDLNADILGNIYRKHIYRNISITQMSSLLNLP